MPLRSRSPRSSNSIPEPETRSRTVDGDEHLVGGGSGDTRPDMDGDPRDLVAEQLALAGVKAGPELEPQVVRAVADRHGTADRAGGAVEGGEEPVASGVDLATAERSSSRRTAAWWRSSSSAQSWSPKRPQPLGRADEVGEENRCQDAVGLGRGPDAVSRAPRSRRGSRPCPASTTSGRRPGTRRTGRRGCARRCSGPPRRGRRGRRCGASRPSGRGSWARRRGRRRRCSSSSARPPPPGLAQRR